MRRRPHALGVGRDGENRPTNIPNDRQVPWQTFILLVVAVLYFLIPIDVNVTVWSACDYSIDRYTKDG